jgi:hypothetical protein
LHSLVVINLDFKVSESGNEAWGVDVVASDKVEYGLVVGVGWKVALSDNL